jgi:hypothetical protein
LTAAKSHNLSSNLTPAILSAALLGLEAQQARLDAHIAEVQRMLGARPPQPAAPAAAPRLKRKLSAAGRKRIAAAQKKRWAGQREKKIEAPAVAAKGPRPKRKLSAAGRKRIVEATRKRWAEFHRQKAAAKAKEPARKTTAKPKKKAVVKAATQPAIEGASE